MTTSVLLNIGGILLLLSAVTSQSCDGNTEFLPHPTDCHLFYTCAGETPVLIECAEDLWFNPKLGYCDFPDTSFCDASTASTTPATTPECTSDGFYFLPHPTDCSLFYTCSSGQLSLTECSSGLWFNSVLGMCSEPDQSMCSEPTTGTTSTTSQTTVATTTAPPPVCEDTGFYFIPHPTQCSLFYVCIEGDIMLTDCADGLWFNSGIGACDEPDEAFCSEVVGSTTPTVVTSTTTAGSTTTPTVVTSTTTAGSTTTPTPPVCDGTGFYFIPHPTMCSQFYICSGGTVTLMDCADGLWFNPNTDVCYEPSGDVCNLL